MQQIENKFKDPESKNKLKQLKIDAQKQIERNKIILKDFINQYVTQDIDNLSAGQGERGGKTHKMRKMDTIGKEVRKQAKKNLP